MPWIRRKLRGNRVFVRTDADGRIAAGPDNRVEIVYRLTADAPVYRAGLRNLEPTGDPNDEVPREPGPGEGAPTGKQPTEKTPSAGGKKRAAAAKPAKAQAAAPEPGADDIVIYTDGACTGNPGPMGTGAVIVNGGERREISEYLGVGTNNIAELTAIEQALTAIPKAQRGRRVLLHTDSSYSIGVLSQGWKAKANSELIARIRRLVAQFPGLEFVKVRGHAGVPDNERCDELARQAISRRS